MLNLSELQQFITFAQCGTLSAAAEVLHISQPTLTRTMHHIEEAFGAKLFHRGKNRIELTQTGLLAVEQAHHILSEVNNAVHCVQDFERSLHTITIKSCAPAPLWTLLPHLSQKFRKKTISSQLADLKDIIESVKSKDSDIGILPYSHEEEGLICKPYLREELFVCVPKNHALSSETSLTFSQINGFNCLLRDHIGFWSYLVKEKMPSSRFLVQTDAFEFDELVRTSTLLSFTTNIANPLYQIPAERTMIPLTDSHAKVSYHLIMREDSNLKDQKFL